MRHSARKLVRTLALGKRNTGKPTVNTSSQSSLLKVNPKPPVARYQCRVITDEPQSKWPIAELTMHPDGVELTYEGFSHLFAISEIRKIRLEQTLEINKVMFEWRMDRTKPVLTETYLAMVHREDGTKISDHFAQIVNYAMLEKGIPMFEPAR